jgi:hypothetical protein
MNLIRIGKWFPRLFLAIALAATLAPARSAERIVVVNGEALSSRTLAAIENHYHTTIPGGRYWYDRVSGVWGREGGPAAGHIQAGLNLGGPLWAQVSNGDTGVLVNGRRLTYQEVMALQRLVGPIRPARYWLDAHGNAGYEGGPALVNLVVAHRRLSGTNGGSGGGWNRNTQFGNWGGDGKCSYYSHPGGSSVMIGNC